MKKDIMNASVTFSNGITVVNATPHSLNFVDIDGTEVVVPTSVPAGEKTGPLVINAKPVETPVSDIFVRTEFKQDPAGVAIINEIENFVNETGARVAIVGSMIAVNAYPGKVCGMVPAPGFERVPPAQKKMRCDKFTVA